ncbi:flavodoxin family protein, partial [Escherichia coli]|nr:flavodoxin family protein [Escherichia coli]
ALKGKELKLVVTTGSDAAKYRKDGEYSHTMEELLSPFEVVAYKVGMNYAEPFLVQGTATIGDAELDQAAADYVSAILD